jgi:three-Cys-motif partner protein
VPVPEETIWAIVPHTFAKHQILRNYLDAWLPIMSTISQRLVYIDGFSGPGEYKNGEPGSPIIALEAAKNHPAPLARDLVYIFIEERADRVAHLKSRVAALKLSGRFHVTIQQGTFAENLTSILNGLGPVAPTFALIDPFGFAGIPYALIRRLLGKNKSEVLITFMVDSMNRWLTHKNEEIRGHITEAFGTEDALKIAFGNGDRAGALKDLYQRQLREAAKFVRYFEMRDHDNRVVYYLFFASNNAKGHLKMKEAMWKVDPHGDFKFSDATNPAQTLLFSSPSSSPLADDITAKFQGVGQLRVEQVENYVNDETAYLGRHMREALAQLEAAGKLSVAATKADGKKRQGKTFPKDVLVTFR